MSERPLAAVGLIRARAEPNLVLVVSRHKDGGRFGLPGGKVELGETLQDALVRELREEVDIEVQSFFPLYDAPTRRHHTHVFKIDRYNGMPKSRENEVVQWVDYKRLLDNSYCFYAEWYREFYTAIGIL